MPLGMVSSIVSSSRRRASRGGVGCGELDGGALDLDAAGLQVFGHAVEGLDEVAELFGGGLFDAVGVVAGGDLFHGVGEGFHGAGDLLGEIEREPGAGEEREAGEHQQQKGIEEADLAALAVEGPVGVGGGLHGGHGRGHALRHGKTDDDHAALSDGADAESVFALVDDDLRAVALGDLEDGVVDGAGEDGLVEFAGGERGLVIDLGLGIGGGGTPVIYLGRHAVFLGDVEVGDGVAFAEDSGKAALKRDFRDAGARGGWWWGRRHAWSQG